MISILSEAFLAQVVTGAILPIRKKQPWILQKVMWVFLHDRPSLTFVRGAMAIQGTCVHTIQIYPPISFLNIM
jgi:hypothetical protein